MPRCCKKAHHLLRLLLITCEETFHTLRFFGGAVRGPARADYGDSEHRLFLPYHDLYFILKWLPKIVVDMGYAALQAAGVLVWANVGGLAGAVLLSVLS